MACSRVNFTFTFISGDRCSTLIYVSVHHLSVSLWQFFHLCHINVVKWSKTLHSVSYWAGGSGAALSVSMGSTTEESWFHSRQRQETFFSFLQCADWLWGPHSLLVQWVPAVKRTVKLTTQLHLVPKLSMSGAIPPVPNMSSWNAQGATLLIGLEPDSSQWEARTLMV
jgi:hypothetical protein